jgi:hypothetical protein
MAWGFLIVPRSRGIEPREPTARFVHQKVYRRKIPVVGTGTGEGSVEPPGRDGNEAIGE